MNQHDAQSGTVGFNTRRPDETGTDPMKITKDLPD